MASALVEATTPRPLDTFPGFAIDRPDPAEVFLSFTDARWPAMGALALAAIPLLADRALAGRIRLALDPEVAEAGPAWLVGLDQITITDVVLHCHLLGDGDNIVVSWAWPGGEAGTAVIYIDHNAGTAVKDAFVLPETAREILGLYRDLDDGHSRIGPIDPAEARARVAEAIERGDQTVPPFESETWPACRPLVEWVLGHLPDGGTGHLRPDWSQEDRRELLDAFLGSNQARTVADVSEAESAVLAEPLIWFGCDYGPGDPLRWSPVSVEIVLRDWYRRKVIGLPEAHLRRLPEVLAAFVRFAHERRRVPAELTGDTLDAVAHWGELFQVDVAASAARSAADDLARRASGLDPLALRAIGDVGEVAYDHDDDLLDLDLADLGLVGPGRGQAADIDDPVFMGRLIDDLEQRVTALAGGPAAYAALTDDPLAEVAFDWSAVPEAHRAATAATLDLLDRWATDLFDREVATIARVVLAALVAIDPAALARSKKPDSLAAAILAFLMRRLSAPYRAPDRPAVFGWRVFTQTDLARATGVSASSIRARSATVADVIARATVDWPAVLHSTQRAELIRSRELISQWRADHR